MNRRGWKCDKREASSRTCSCGCYGCKHHCGAHWPWWLRVKYWIANRGER